MMVPESVWFWLFLLGFLVFLMTGFFFDLPSGLSVVFLFVSFVVFFTALVWLLFGGGIYCYVRRLRFKWKW